ncbi:MAG: methyltransferase type 11 [Denitrovibrio sp.]|nr:MAG: methyltransferase type 11 [Denitrovibrio sp.]
MTNKNNHDSEIIDQFTKQAIPFTKVSGHLDSMELLIEFSKLSASDTVLDVACGPGMVTCEFANKCSHITGIDLTPAMIEQAKQRQQETALNNITWDIGNATPLPYDDNTFSLVITRYSFHHFIQPDSALDEMIRVCKPGGRVLVADVGINPNKSNAYDTLEIMRDPSHVHALSTTEFDQLFQTPKLEKCIKTAYGVDIELEAQLKASFPKDVDEQKLREMVTNDIGTNNLDINARRKGKSIIYTVPIVVYVGVKSV